MSYPDMEMILNGNTSVSIGKVTQKNRTGSMISYKALRLLSLKKSTFEFLIGFNTIPKLLQFVANVENIKTSGGASDGGSPFCYISRKCGRPEPKPQPKSLKETATKAYADHLVKQQDYPP